MKDRGEKTESTDKGYLDPRRWYLKKKKREEFWSQMNMKKNMPNHIIVKLLKINDREKKLEAIREK